MMYKKEFDMIFQIAEKKVDDIEILLTSENSFSVKINKQEIDSFDYSDSKGIGIRVINNGKVGYAYTEDFSKSSFETIVNEAIENSKVVSSEEEAHIENYPDTNEAQNFYNKELENIDISKKIDLTKNIEKFCMEKDKRILLVPYALYGDGKVYKKIANSKGLNKEFLSNTAYGFAYVLAADNEKKRMGSDFVISRDFSEINAEKLAENSTKKALDLLYDQPIEKNSYPVVFDNETMATLLSTFSSIFYADNVLRGMSLLADKLNKKIANSMINIIDDPLLENGFASRPFDSEGFPSKKVNVIEDGFLKTFLHNSQTAKKLNTSSTGHGSRSYKTSLLVSPSNFYLKPGNIDKQKLYTQHKKVVEIVSLQGMHSGANPISGDFSLSGEGFLWENGERVSSLESFTVSGNFIQLLNDIELIANNLKFNLGSVGSAAVLVNKLNISS